MRRAGWIFIFVCVLMLSAGFVLGYLWAQRSRPAPVRPDWMAQLKLTPVQHQQFDAIWNPVHKKNEEVRDRRHQLGQERDQALRNLLSDAQKADFDKIEQDYQGRTGALDQEREKMIQDANQRSRALLTAEQKTTWDVLSKQQHEHHRHAGATQTSATHPASQPTESSP